MNSEMKMINEKALNTAEGHMEAQAPGCTASLSQGEQLQLIRLILLKTRKGESLAQIASDLEETEANIKPLYDRIISMPGASPEEILTRALV